MAKKLRVESCLAAAQREYEVSVRSARSVIEAIDRKKYAVIPIAINKEGKWLPPAEAVCLFPSPRADCSRLAMKTTLGRRLLCSGTLRTRALSHSARTPRHLH